MYDRTHGSLISLTLHHHKALAPQKPGRRRYIKQPPKASNSNQEFNWPLFLHLSAVQVVPGHKASDQGRALTSQVAPNRRLPGTLFKSSGAKLWPKELRHNFGAHFR